jgi:hypothetical protein
MGLLSGNSCNIITLLPLGLDCDSINASTPDDTNGLITLYITGGTPPYNVSWNNGSKGTLLTNLSPGDYTATVVDYYGDFSATTTCTVDFDSFYIEEFENCKDSTKIYYLADLPSIFTSGKTYELTTQTGCWLSSGTTLYTGQTYFNQFAVINSGPYDNCQDCLPPPEPTPTYPENLCLTYRKGPTIYQTTFYSANTINNYPSWSSSTPPFLIYYSTGNTRWEISGWTTYGAPYYGVPTFNNPTPPPTGVWTLNGINGYTLTVTSGVCTSPPLNLILEKTNPSCTTSSDGTIFANVSGGISPYYYSLDNINFYTTNILTNLAAGTYTVYVKDSSTPFLTTSQSVTLTPQNTFQNYTINLTQTSQTTSNSLGSQTKYTNFKIEIIPTLPPTKTVTFDIPINVLVTGNTTTNSPTISTTQINTITFSTSGTSTITGPSTSPITTTTNPRNTPCNRVNVNTSAYTQTYQASITGSGFILGAISQSLTTPSVSLEQNGCGLQAALKDIVTVINQQLNPTTCSYLNNLVQPLIVESTRTGVTSFS